MLSSVRGRVEAPVSGGLEQHVLYKDALMGTNMDAGVLVEWEEMISVYLRCNN